MRRLLVIVVLLGLAVGGWFLWQRNAAKTGAAGEATGAHAGLDMPAEPQRPTPVLTAKVARRDMPVTLEGLGSVTAYYTVAVKPQVDGKLIEVPFREGQPVKKGDVLAQIDPRPFAIQLHQAESVHARDAAQLKNAKVNLARYTELRKQNLVPSQQVTDQLAQVEQFEAQLRGDVAAEESAKLMLEYAKVVSPIDGVTGVRQVDPGNIVHQADPTGIVVVTQLDPIAVLFTLPEDDLAAIQRGMLNGQLTVEAYSRDGMTKLATGKLEVVDNQINQATATAKLKAIFPNPEHVLWPNQFVKARVQVAVRAQVTVIPAVAVQHGPPNPKNPGGTFVYVVGADMTAQVRPVEVQALEGDEAIIAKGLEVDEPVVIDGQSRLKPGSKVALPGQKGEGKDTKGEGKDDKGGAKGAEGKSGEGKGKWQKN
jgi:multidrug efflux system membrane fusion protein